jgi:hypothetical protein
MLLLEILLKGFLLGMMAIIVRNMFVYIKVRRALKRNEKIIFENMQAILKYLNEKGNDDGDDRL